MREREEARVAGLRVIIPELRRDERGFFCVTRDQDSWQYTARDHHGWRELAARSAHGVIRGMHVRSGAGEAKLARCSRGAVLDVVTDLRPGSPTYRATARLVLDDLTQVSVHIPAGCAHGWQALTSPADMAYTIAGRYDPAEDLEIDWADPELAVSWPLPPHPASRRGMPLAEAVRRLGSSLWPVILSFSALSGSRHARFLPAATQWRSSACGLPGRTSRGLTVTTWWTCSGRRGRKRRSNLEPHGPVRADLGAAAIPDGQGHDQSSPDRRVRLRWLARPPPPAGADGLGAGLPGIVAAPRRAVPDTLRAGRP